MKIDLNFIPLNTVPKGVKNLAVYNENNEKVGAIPLGNLAPKSKGDKLYTFGALSDVHLPYNTGPEDFIRALNYFNNIEKVNFICISGDMGSTGVDSEWANFKAHVDAHSPNTPVYISAGNHDAGQSGNKSHDYPIPYTGNPLYYSFTQGDDVFIMFGMTFWGNPPFSNESLQWLYETLEKNRNKRCFVFQHMMRKGHAGDASGRYSWDGLNNTNGQVFLSLMEHYKNVLWFHGHSHCEFEHQDTLSLPNSNYDRAFGCHSIHVPSCCMTRNEDNGYDYEDSEGYVVDVYENGIHLRGRDFVAEKFLPIASYWIDNALVEIKSNTYSDPYGVIDTSSKEVEPDEIIVIDNSKFILNSRYSKASGELVELNGVLGINIDVKPNTTYKLKYAGSITDITVGYDTLYLLNAEGTVSIANGSGNIKYMTQGVVYNSDNTGLEIIFTTQADTTNIWFSILFKEAGRYISNVDEIANVVLTLGKFSDDGITLPEGATYEIDKRYSAASPTGAKERGGFVAVKIPISTDGRKTYKINISNLPYQTIEFSENAIHSESQLMGVDYVNPESMTTFNKLNSATGCSFTSGDDKKSCTITCKPSVVCEYILVSFLVAELNGQYISSIGESILDGITITLEIIGIANIISPDNVTNVLPLSVDEDGNDFVGTNGEDGYITGYRIKSTGIIVEESGTCTTGFIPTKVGDIIRIANISLVGNGTNEKIAQYDESKAFLSVWGFSGNTLIEDGNVYVFKAQAQGYIRFSAYSISEETIVTINQVMTKEKHATNLLHSAVNEDGTDFVGPNGEDGYKTGYMINANHEEEENPNACVSGYIRVSPDTKIRIHGVTQWNPSNTDGTVDRIVFYDYSKNVLGATSLMTANEAIIMEDDNSTYVFMTNYWFDGVYYMRLSTGIIDENTIVTKSEPIV